MSSTDIWSKGIRLDHRVLVHHAVSRSSKVSLPYLSDSEET